MPALPEAEAARGVTAVAASTAEPIAAERRNSLLVLNSYFSDPSGTLHDIRTKSAKHGRLIAK
jgi:hypothetical protein